MFETHIRLTRLSSLTARLDTLESACHLATIVRVATGFRTCVRLPDGSVIGDETALPVAQK